MRIAPLALLVGTAAGLLAATQPIADTDLFWQLATGRETLADGFVRTDLFSWTVRGAPVSLDQWLGQVILYASYAVGGWRSIAMLRVVLVVALAALVVVNASLLSARRPLAVVAAAMPAFVLTRAVWVDRPELLGLVCFAALLPLLHLVRRGSAAALAGSVVLVAFWANVHGSFALGVVLVVLVCLEGIANDRARWRAYAVAIAGVALASIATPAGVGTWTAPGFHFFSPPRAIEEWNVVDVRTPLGVAYVVTLAFLIASAFLGPKLALRDLVVLLPVAFLSLTAARQAPLLAIAAAPLFADRAARLIDASATRGWRARATEGPRARRVPVAPERRDTARTAGGSEAASLPRSSEGFGRAGAASRIAQAATLAPAIALVAAALAIAPGGPDERAFPTGALGKLPAGDGVLARYEWGGWLIWSAPATPVFVDGRLTPYISSGVMGDYQWILAAKPGWRDAIARRGVRALLVTPTDPVAVRAEELGWHEIATSDLFVLITAP